MLDGRNQSLYIRHMDLGFSETRIPLIVSLSPHISTAVDDIDKTNRHVAVILTRIIYRQPMVHWENNNFSIPLLACWIFIIQNNIYSMQKHCTWN